MVMPLAICTFLTLAVTAVLYFSGKFSFSDNDHYFQVVINSTEILFETDEKFLSVALDISFMRCLFHTFTDGEWESLKKFSRLLSPAYLRIGGTDADRTVFRVKRTSSPLEFSNTTSCENYTSHDELIISGQDWMKLNLFAQKSNLSMIFDLNVLLRKESHWDSTNAKLLVNFSNTHSLPLDFQLGNEPNSFPHVFNITISGSQLANDFYELKKILNSTENYRESKVIGPDVTKPKNLTESLEIPSLKFLNEFLSKGNSVDVVSWHQYYLNGNLAKLEDFINLETFELLLPDIESILSTVRKYFAFKPVWISETSSAFGGGAPGLSDRFVASFLWVDKLGMAARSKISVVIRQSLFEGSYALIGEKLSPNPDFWISVLYKYLVGSRVLDVNVTNSEKSSSLRLYGHCVALNSSVNGNIVIYGINISKEEKLFVPSMISITYPVYAFIFRPKFDNLTSKTVLLNDHELHNEAVIEDMVKMGKEVKCPLRFPPLSVGFWVLNETEETACKR